jgi:hypothetical protein
MPNAANIDDKAIYVCKTIQVLVAKVAFMSSQTKHC